MAIKITRRQLRRLVEGTVKEAFGDDHYGPELDMFLDELQDALFEMDGVRDVRSFGDSSLLTSDKGYVVTMTNGDTFQVSVVPGRPR